MKLPLPSIFKCLLLLLPLSARAITLEECRALAEANYPLIRRTALVERTASFTVQNLGKNFLPSVQVSGQATYQSDVAALPGLLQGLLRQNGFDYRGLARDQYRLAVDVQQLLYDGGQTRAQRELAVRQGQTETASTEVDAYAVRQRVDDLYFSLLLVHERLRLNAELQGVLGSNRAKLDALLRGGVAMQSDVDAVDAELLRARQQAVELQSARSVTQAVLALFIGRDTTALAVLEKPADRLPAEVPFLRPDMRPEMRLFDAQTSEAAARRRTLDAGRRPSVSLFAQGWYGYPGLNMFDDMFSRSWGLNGMVGVRLSWNLSRFYTRRTDRRLIDTQIELVENARSVFLFNNRLQAVQDSGAAARARSLLAADDEIVQLRRRVRQAAERRLEGGVIDVNALVQEIGRENEARISRSLHEIEMLQNVWRLKTTLNR